jgi:hypothetical protein
MWIPYIKPGDPRLKSEFITYESLKEAVKSSFIAANRDERNCPESS